MTIHILDASAMIAYLRGEQESASVQTLLFNPSARCYAHTINLCEVYYESVRQAGVKTARATIDSLYADGVVERRNMSRKFWHRVGELKARGAISLPDCVCISLAQELGGVVVTTDHREFDPLVPLGIAPITFIR